MLRSLITRVRLRLKDMGTLKALCLGAERYAHKNGEESPGAEHFLLSAIDLPDGTARRVFERFGVDRRQIEQAIADQHSEALASIGIDASKLGIDESTLDIETPTRALYTAKPSAQSMMKALVALRKGDKARPLLGLHVVEVLSSRELGPVARTLRHLGVDRDALKEAVARELDDDTSPASQNAGR